MKTKEQLALRMVQKMGVKSVVSTICIALFSIWFANRIDAPQEFIWSYPIAFLFAFVGIAIVRGNMSHDKLLIEETKSIEEEKEEIILYMNGLNDKYKKATAELSEANAKLSLLQKDATAMQTLSNERRLLNESVQTLSKDKQLLTERMQSLEKSNASAMQKLADAYKNKEATLLASNELLEKQVKSFQKAEAKRKEEEERAKLTATINAKLSANGNKASVLDEAFPNTDWRSLISEKRRNELK